MMMMMPPPLPPQPCTHGHMLDRWLDTRSLFHIDSIDSLVLLEGSAVIVSFDKTETRLVGVIITRCHIRNPIVKESLLTTLL